MGDMLLGSRNPKVRRRVYVRMIMVIIYEDRVRKLLSPCHRSFRLSQPPIYSQLKSKLSLVDCQTKAHAVAWRVLQGQGPKPMCIELPTNENDLTNAMGANGYCTVDPEGKHKEWYLQQGTYSWVYMIKSPNSLRLQLCSENITCGSGRTLIG
jgi:hypothetical protein